MITNEERLAEALAALHEAQADVAVLREAIESDTISDIIQGELCELGWSVRLSTGEPIRQFCNAKARNILNEFDALFNPLRTSPHPGASLLRELAAARAAVTVIHDLASRYYRQLDDRLADKILDVIADMQRGGPDTDALIRKATKVEGQEC